MGYNRSGSKLIINELIKTKFIYMIPKNGNIDDIVSTWFSDKNRVIAGNSRAGIFDCLVVSDYEPVDGQVGIIAGTVPEAIDTDVLKGTRYRWVASHLYPDE